MPISGTCGFRDSFLVRKSTPVEILGDDRHTGTMFRSDLIALVKIGSLSKSLCFYEAVQERALIQNTQIHFDTGNNTCVFWVVSVLD